MIKNKAHIILSNKIFISGFIFVILFIITVQRPMMGDEGLWSYIGKLWTIEGMAPYKDAVENKTVGIFILYAISYLLFGINYLFVRILGILAVIISMLYLNKIGKIIHSYYAGIISMYVFGLSMCWDFTEGQYPFYTENFMVLFTIISFYFLIKNLKISKNNISNYFLSGLFIGIAISFKQIAVSSLLALIVFSIIINKEKKVIENLYKLSAIAIGMFSGLLLLYLPLYFSNVSLWQYIEGSWLILLHPGSSADINKRINTLFPVWLNGRIAIFYVLIILYIFQKKHIKNKLILTGLVIWFILDFLGAISSGHYFRHHAKQLMPALSILSGFLISSTLFKGGSIMPKYNNTFAKILIGIIIILMPYKNLVLNGYLKGFNKIDTEIGLWIKENTSPEDYVYTYGRAHAGVIMSYSERLSPSKYFNVIFLSTEKEFSLLENDLHSNPPEIIVINRWVYNRPLSDTIMNNYYLVFSKKRYDIYRRKSI